MRNFDILEYLETHAYVASPSELASHLHVQKRTIYDDLKRLRQQGMHYGFSIDSDSRAKYTLSIHDIDRYKKFKLNCLMQKQLAPDERPVVTAFILICAIRPVTTDELALKLGIGRSLMFKVLNTTQDLLTHTDLKLIRKRHYGAWVEGTLDQRIGFILMCEHSNFVQNKLEELVRCPHTFDSHLLAICKQIQTKISYRQFQIARLVVLSTLYLLGVKGLEFDLSKTKPHELESDLIKLSEKNCMQPLSVSMSRYCLSYLEKYLSGDSKDEDKAQSISHIVMDCLKKEDERTHNAYTKDATLCSMLISHVSLLVEHGSSEPNDTDYPFEVEILHPDAMLVAFRIKDQLERNFDISISKTEVAYIALHIAAHHERERQNRLGQFARIAVICTSGNGGAYFTKMQLKQAFANAEVETFSFTELNQVRRFKPDVIFSMVPLHEYATVPVIRIKEFLSTADIHQLQQALAFADVFDERKLVEEQQMQTPSLWRHLEILPLARLSGIRSYNKLIKELATSIVNAGYAPNALINYVLKREEFASTIYLNGVALPHPLESVAYRDTIAIAQIHASDETLPRLVILIALRPDHVHFYKALNEQLYKLMQNPEHIEKLVDATNEHEFIHLLMKWEQE